MLLDPSSERPGAAAVAMPTILERILADRRTRVAEAQRRTPEKELRRRAEAREPRGFTAALRRHSGALMPAVIAEIKRASPSRGVLRAEFDVPALAAAYERGGAAALSVLTEEDHFQGRLAHLREARDATRLPLLRKDFLFCSYQVWEAAAAGADAVLLIAAMLDDATLEALLRETRAAGLDCLCEVHDSGELRRVIQAGADCIGVNNRDLRSFEVDLGCALALAPEMPAGCLAVAESGLRSGMDLARMAAAGYRAVLIGEHFMRAADPGGELAALLAAVPREVETLGTIKICGLTNLEDALAAQAAGADALGFVFAASPRRVTVEQAAAITAALPAGGLRVGVFAGTPVTEIRQVAERAGLQAVQLHGAYEPAAAHALTPALAVWRALPMPAEAAAITTAMAAWRGVASTFLLDTTVDGVHGGSGRSFDWGLARHALAALPPGTRMLVAGGLRASNVAAAIRQSGAGGVDVASGVEAAPGRKDHGQLAAFLRAARAAFLDRNA